MATTYVAVVVAALVAGSVAGTATPAVAATATATAGPTPDVAPGPSAFDIPRSEQVRSEQYWTTQRRARAVHGDLLTRTADDLPPRQRPPATELAAPPPTSTGTAYTRGGLVTRTAGKLYVTLSGVDYACSASVVTSISRDLVVTAGHCVHGGGPAGRYATNVVFAPGFANGTTPDGLWSARRITTTNAWATRADFDSDVGFIALNTRNNLHVQQQVGALGITFNLPRSNYQWAFGYPVLPPYNGGRLSYCAGLPVADPYGGTALGLRCTMTAGASGGPWLVGVSRYAVGHGFVDSVVSYNYVEDPTRLYGPYFGNTIKALYTTATSM